MDIQTLIFYSSVHQEPQMEFIVILKAVFLGIVEGITEFLPISSTGHMILVDEFLKLSGDKSFTTAFEVIIQLGAILSVVVIYFNKLWPFSGSAEEKKAKWLLWAKVIFAVLPAVILGFGFHKVIEEKLFNPITVASALIFYGIVIILLESFWKKSAVITDVANVTFKIALLIGLFQCLAMMPGTSRSAATIIGGLLLGLNRAAAAEFSFFLAIPTMAGASLLKIVKNGLSFNAGQWGIIAIGFIVSFLVAWLVIKVFINFIQKHDFKVFGYYRIVLGIIVLFILFK
jgi:undecaprenyl-diphosphatase